MIFDHVGCHWHWSYGTQFLKRLFKEFYWDCYDTFTVQVIIHGILAVNQEVVSCLQWEHNSQILSQGILTSAKLITFVWYTYITFLQSLAANKAYDKLDMTVEDALKNREIVSDIWSVISFEKRGCNFGLRPLKGGPFYVSFIYREYLVLYASLWTVTTSVRAGQNVMFVSWSVWLWWLWL